jgi:hypothetical protein
VYVVSAGQGCRAGLHGKAAGQGCRAGLHVEVVHFSKNNFSKNSTNDIQFFKKIRKNSKKFEKFLLHILSFSNHCFWFKRPLLHCNMTIDYE